MTVIDTIPGARRRSRPIRIRPAGRRARAAAHRPRPSRPAGAPLRYRGTGVLTSATSHRPRAITPATTVALALLAALITVWLHMVAQFGAAVRGGVPGMTHHVPDRLEVVRIAPGETLRQLAARVAPDAPSGQVAQRIRELNGIGPATPTAGQTLIVPVG
jgi:hypothetical protein